MEVQEQDGAHTLFISCVAIFLKIAILILLLILQLPF